MLATGYARQAEADVETTLDTGSLPDRLTNPEDYGPLLLTTEEHTAVEPIISKDLVNNNMNPVYTYGTISQ